MFTTLSDGTADGIVLMYVKKGVIYPIGLTKVDALMIDAILSSMGVTINVISDKPQGMALDLRGGAES